MCELVWIGSRAGGSDLLGVEGPRGAPCPRPPQGVAARCNWQMWSSVSAASGGAPVALFDLHDPTEAPRIVDRRAAWGTRFQRPQVADRQRAMQSPIGHARWLRPALERIGMPARWVFRSIVIPDGGTIGSLDRLDQARQVIAIRTRRGQKPGGWLSRRITGTGSRADRRMGRGLTRRAFTGADGRVRRTRRDSQGVTAGRQDNLVIWDDDPFDLDSPEELVFAAAALLDDERTCACACGCEGPVEPPDDICRACREGRHSRPPDPRNADRRR